MNNPFNMFGQFANLFANKFGNMNNMFSTINNFASQYDPRSFNPEQQVNNLVESGQMSPQMRDMLYSFALGISNQMNGGGQR